VPETIFFYQFELMGTYCIWLKYQEVGFIYIQPCKLRCAGARGDLDPAAEHAERARGPEPHGLQVHAKHRHRPQRLSGMYIGEGDGSWN
jgi:hypothetical protein